MTSQQKSYLAGLLDGDGSIMLQLKPQKDMKFLFRVKAVVILYQDNRYHQELLKLQKLIGHGYVYQRNDHMSELRLEGFTCVRQFLSEIKPNVRFKQKQVEYMLRAVEIGLKGKKTIADFLSLCRFSDQIAQCNYSSKRRIYTALYVLKLLKEHNLVPVTTGS